MHYLGGRGLLSQRLIPLGSALVELAAQVSNDLLRIDRRAVRRRRYLRVSSDRPAYLIIPRIARSSTTLSARLSLRYLRNRRLGNLPHSGFANAGAKRRRRCRRGPYYENVFFFQTTATANRNRRRPDQIGIGTVADFALEKTSTAARLILLRVTRDQTWQPKARIALRPYRRDGSDDGSVYAGAKKRHDLIGDLFNGSRKGQRIDVAIGDQRQQRQKWRNARTIWDSRDCPQRLCRQLKSLRLEGRWSAAARRPCSVRPMGGQPRARRDRPAQYSGQKSDLLNARRPARHQRYLSAEDLRFVNRSASLHDRTIGNRSRNPLPERAIACDKDLGQRTVAAQSSNGPAESGGKRTGLG